MRDELLNIRNCRKTPVACVFWCLQIAKMFDLMCVITGPIPSVVVKVGRRSNKQQAHAGGSSSVKPSKSFNFQSLLSRSSSYSNFPLCWTTKSLSRCRA